MAKIKFENGVVVNFNGDPSPEDIEEVARTVFGQEEKKGFFGRAFDNLKERGGQIKNTFEETAEGKISPAETGVRFVGDVAGGVFDIAGAALSPQFEKLAEKEWAKPVFQALSSGMDKYESWKNENELNRRTAEVVEALTEIVGVPTGGSLAKATGKSLLRAGVKTGGKAGEASAKIAGKVGDVGKYVKNKFPNFGDRAAKILASDPDQQVKTILKETNTSKLDEYLSIAEKYSMDRRNLSGFEKVGDTMSEAAKQIKDRLSSLGLQKSAILQKAKNGLQDFTAPTRTAILKVMNLPNSSIKAEILDRLKSIKTKLDADLAIDDIQDMIYSNTMTLTLAKGSKLEKQLRGIIGELNENLKKDLPTAYRTLNKDLSKGYEYLSSLNRGLGEKVGGVSARGASLVKQFFSPAGSKTKELFEYIKKTTGIDLAQEATVAKFAEELFDNPNVRSLLGGLPTTRQGVLDRVIDFTIDKTGVGEGARNFLRKGSINRAKSLTK